LQLRRATLKDCTGSADRGAQWHDVARLLKPCRAHTLHAGDARRRAGANANVAGQPKANWAGIAEAY